MRYFRGSFSRYGALVLQFVNVALLTNHLSTADATRYFAVLGIALASFALAGLGMPEALVARVPALVARGEHDRAAATLRHGFLRSLAMSAAMAVLVAGVSFGIWNEWGIALATAAWWAGYALVFIASQVLMAVRRESQGTFVFYVLINITTTVALATVIVATPARGLMAFAAVSATSALATGVVAAVMVMRLVPRSAARPLDDLVRVGLPLAIGRASSGVLFWSPVWAASATLPSDHAAQVAIAVRIFSAVAALMAAVRYSVRPEMAELGARGDWAAVSAVGSRIAGIATVFAIAVTIAVPVFGPWAIPIAFGPEYALVWVPLTILCVAGIADSASGPVDVVLRMTGHGLSVLVVQVLASVGAVALQFAGGMLLGEWAIPAAFAVAYSAMFACLLVLARRWHDVKIVPRLSRQSVGTAG